MTMIERQVEGRTIRLAAHWMPVRWVDWDDAGVTPAGPPGPWWWTEHYGHNAHILQSAVGVHAFRCSDCAYSWKERDLLPFGMAHYPGTPVPRPPILSRPVMRAQPAVRPAVEDPGPAEYVDTDGLIAVEARVLRCQLAEVLADRDRWRAIAEELQGTVRALEAKADRFTWTRRLTRWLRQAIRA